MRRFGIGGCSQRHRHPHVLRVPFYPIPRCGHRRPRRRSRHRILRTAAQRLARAYGAVHRALVRAARRPVDRGPGRPVPGIEGQAGARPRGREEGRAVLDTRGNRAWRDAAIRQSARVRRGSGRGLLFRNPGFGSHRIRRRDGASLGVRRPERPPLPIHRARADRTRRPAARARVDAGHQRVGQGASSRNTRAARRESKSCVFPRSAGAATGLARCADRRTDRDARRAAAGGTHDCRRSACHSPRRARIPRHDPAAVENAAGATRDGPGHRRRHPGRRARRLFLGVRPAGGARGRPHATGRTGLLWPKGADPSAR
jgi:hypothetical protein